MDFQLYQGPRQRKQKVPCFRNLREERRGKGGGTTPACNFRISGTLFGKFTVFPASLFPYFFLGGGMVP